MAANTTPATTNTPNPANPADVPATAPAVPDATATASAPSGAVWDALTANPGATVAVIAKAAGLNAADARTELAAFAESGHAVSAPGEKGRGGRTKPDTWTPAPTDAPAPATDPEAVPAADAGTDEAPATDDGPDSAAEPTGAPADTTADAPDADADHDEDDEDDDEVPVAPVVDADTLADAMRVMTEEAERRAVADAEIKARLAEEEARRAKIDAELASAQRTEATRRALTDLLAAVTTAYAAVVAEDELEADAGLQCVFAATHGVAQAIGAVPARPGKPRTAGTGGGPRTGRAAPRPLRPEVIAHLQAHPGKDFTPGEIGKVLDRSSGAVANALDKLVELGDATLTTEKPARYTLATGATATAPATDEATGPDTTPATIPDAPDATDASDASVTDAATGEAPATDAAA
ncbi:hypothetical protein J4573_31450 [Actinomadura barringtoniae]|uniref:Uncharacterized protein n=1 Tax=Actinomadura barringtoniae TaxID=1427535 RepID=A0A939T689_9ACTN|nr:hypothetical protein [Actinomadura barringtoniae]MBO2451643.1 hypothetical protein [Actinomadura barringtoniae]